MPVKIFFVQWILGKENLPTYLHNFLENTELEKRDYQFELIFHESDTILKKSRKLFRGIELRFRY